MWRLLLVAVLALGALNARPVSAAQGITCDSFDYQPDAQRYFDNVKETYPELIPDEAFPDGDGIACPHLPDRPSVLADAQSVNASIDPELDFIGFVAAGYSRHYQVRIGGVRLASTGDSLEGVQCADLVSLEDLKTVLDPIDRYYLLPAGLPSSIPDSYSEGITAKVVAEVWTIFGDPSEPVLINSWLVRRGLAVVNENFTEGALKRKLERDQEKAKSSGAGVWGDCIVPPLPGQANGADTTSPSNATLNASGSGSQVAQFTIATGATYLLTATTTSGFFAADIYSVSGDWFPGFSITTADGGTFTSAEFLSSGNYYVEITATTNWSVTITALGS